MQRSRARQIDPPRKANEPEHAAVADDRFATAGHEELFAAELAVTCDACGCPMTPEDESYAIHGEGEYVWTRGDEVRREKAPLCPTCASAIFGAALTTWDLEDEG